MTEQLTLNFADRLNTVSLVNAELGYASIILHMSGDLTGVSFCIPEHFLGALFATYPRNVDGLSTLIVLR